MRILYFSFVELDVPNACQTHTLGVLRGFSQNSCIVDALVPRPKTLRPKIPSVYFYYLWPWRFSALGRVWIKILGSIFFLSLCLLNEYDAIYVRELELNPFPRWCSMIFGIPLYIEINSILVQSTEMTDVARNHRIRIEKHQTADFKQASGLIVPSYPRCRWIKDYYGLDSIKVHMILNGTDAPAKEKLDRSKTLRKLNLPEDGFYLGFLGNIWKSYDLLTIIEALDLCQNNIPHLYLLMIGEGPELKQLQEIARTKRLTSHIIFLGYVHSELLFQIMGAVDIGLMNLTKQGLQDGGPITTRFATYASYKIPVIANNIYLDNYPGELVQGLLTVPPEDARALADMIVWLYTHPEGREAKAKILYDFVVKNLTWESVTDKILNIIRKDRKLKRYGIIDK